MCYSFEFCCSCNYSFFSLSLDYNKLTHNVLLFGEVAEKGAEHFLLPKTNLGKIMFLLPKNRNGA